MLQSMLVSPEAQFTRNEVSTETSYMNVCNRCIGGDEFSQWIEDNGEKGECEFDNRKHGEDNHVVTIKDFAKHVDDYFQKHYTVGEPRFDFEGGGTPAEQNYGDQYDEIIPEELCCEDYVYNAVIENMPDYYKSYQSIAVIEEREREYWLEEKFQQWEDFCETVKHSKRFFNIKEMLNNLFGEEDMHKNGAIKPIYTLEIGQKIFRTRLLDDNSFEERVLRKDVTAEELGAPPSEKAKAGRMNVAFIPTFYAAFNEETAIAELRPIIGDEIVLAEFTLNSELKVFDFTVFDCLDKEEATDNGDIKNTRYDFMRNIQHEISRPISPYQKNLEYIPTQIIAEYLKEHFGCHAVIYNSAMHISDKEETRNIVIFKNSKEFKYGADEMLTLTEYKVEFIENITYATKKDCLEGFPDTIPFQ